MRLAIVSTAIVLALTGNSAAGEGEGPKCLKAEINPVTGHILCIDPLGAPVEAPPDQVKPPCKPEDVRGQWSYGPACTPEPDGM